MICLASLAVTGLPLLSQITYGVPRLQHGPGPFGEVAGDDAAGLEVGGAAFGHLQVVDPGELRVLLRAVSAARTKVARSSDGPALLIGWPLRSVSPVSLARGASPA